MEVKRDILWRVYLCFIGIVIFSLAIMGRAIYIQQAQGEYWITQANKQQQHFIDIDAQRGTIYSEDGSMLSTSIPFFDIYIDFGADGLREKEGKRFKENVDSLAYSLANFFKDKSKKEYRNLLEAGYRRKDRYFQLKKNLSFQQYKVLRTFPLVRQGRNRSGFIAEEKGKRLNPFGLLANRTIGLSRDYVTSDGKIKNTNVGLEKTYDTLLKGESGKRLVRFLAGGAYVPVEGSEIEARNGKDIITTLDVNIQDIAENALLKVMEENECVTGTCIVMEVKTGKIKAIANLGRTSDGRYWEDLNYAIRASEPGSTFKLATMLAVLEDKHATLDTKVDLENGRWKVHTRTVYDSEPHDRNDVTVKEAFEYSSNVGMAKMAMAYYAKKPEQFISHLRRLRFDQPSGIDLLGETDPVIKNPKSRTWSATSLPWMSFGYEVLVSPLQTLMLYNAVANNGKLMKPYLINAVTESGIVVRENKPDILEENICSENTLRQLQEALLGVCTSEGRGTGYKLFKDAGYQVAGKTGTALVANGSRGYSDRIYQSSFAGYFPANDPEYSCIVVIKNKPFAKKYYGAAIAGPVFKEVSDKLFALNANDGKQSPHIIQARDSSQFYYAGAAADVKRVLNTLQIRYTDSLGNKDWTKMYAVNYAPVLKAQELSKQQMPDVRGMGLRDALFVLEQMDLNVMVKGRGRVKAQSLNPGSGIAKNQKVTLELN
ncbi:MAG: PASTA domain-containing protein [Chitinophagaceae bacterium]|nr:MAG: PASTA domain-containing protein [Chitinophagaceae bacterium]